MELRYQDPDGSMNILYTWPTPWDFFTWFVVEGRCPGLMRLIAEVWRDPKTRLVLFVDGEQVADPASGF